MFYDVWMIKTLQNFVFFFNLFKFGYNFSFLKKFKILFVLILRQMFDIFLRHNLFLFFSQKLYKQWLENPTFTK